MKNKTSTRIEVSIMVDPKVISSYTKINYYCHFLLFIVKTPNEQIDVNI